MGTEIRTESVRQQEKAILEKENPKSPIEMPLNKIPVNKCICGCNAPMLYAKRDCKIPYSNARENFTVILNTFFKDNSIPALVSEERPIDLYDFFHIIQKVKKECGRVSWRRVSKSLGVFKSSSEFRRPLRKYYKRFLRNFEDWLRDKGPVSIGCIDTSLVIIILKEFLPNFINQKPAHESISTEQTSPVSQENNNSEIADLIDYLISEIEAGKVIMKKRKIEEDPPETKKLVSKDPIFIIYRKNKEEKKPVIQKAKKVKPPKEKKLEKVPKDLPKLDIVNPMTDEFRSKDPALMGYRTDFRKGYLPIEMQEEHEKMEKVQAERDSKAHFIRKKQSAVNIKRSCGVTYVKPTESKQLGVRHEFSPLPPLAFQVGTVDRIIPQDEKTQYFNLAKDIIKEIFESNKLIRATIQVGFSEEDLKKYILGEKTDGEEVFIKGPKELWRLLGKDNFVVLHFDADERTLFSPLGPAQFGNCKIGFLVKKGLCGTRSVKRCLCIPEKDDDPLNMYATQIRLELYITKSLWKNALSTTRKLLCAFIAEFESYIQKLLPEWNDLRENIYKTKIIPEGETIYKALDQCLCPKDSVSTPPKSFWEYKSNIRPGNPDKCSTCLKILYEQVKTYSKGIEGIFESKSPPNWFYLINTRDSFSYDLKVKKSYIQYKDRMITKKVYMFHKDDLPSNYKDWDKFLEGDYVRTGVVAFKNCFTHEELKDLEQEALNTEADFLKGQFINSTAQPSFGAGGKIKRTKFFFGTRYMWTSNQLAEKQSKIAAGVRIDVSETPAWMRNKIENPLVEAGIIDRGFINSIAMNIYHDGKEGLAQHFDDAVRFKQPIYTVKLDSDARLSFGSQFYGYLNGAFCIPCPRGAVCMMEEFSYAANSAKHCVRPCDLAGRSITIIMRQIHPFIMEEARRYDEEIDLPTWFSTLSLDDNSVPYSKQKEMQTKIMMKEDGAPKSSY